MRASIRPSRLTQAGQISMSQITARRFTTLRTFYSFRLSSPTSAPPPRRLSRQGLSHSATFARYNTTLTAPSSSPSSPQTPASSSPTATQPAYEIYFTCKPCSQRSGPHRVTKQGFHKGTTLITCPSCKNRHVVSDHLRIFTDQGGDLVDIMQRHGEKLKKGRLGIRDGQLVGNEGEEEIEFWEDGTETLHLSQEPKSPK
jgi:mitochondrial protein import protein ZIM17